MTFRDLDLRSNFEVELKRSKYTWFDSFRRDKHDATTIMVVNLKMKKLLAIRLIQFFFTLVTCRD